MAQVKKINMKNPNVKLPVYDVIMDDENPELGMEKISLVKDPANKKMFIAFEDHQKKTKLLFSEDRQLVTCALMQPDDLIYRNQGGEEFYVKYSSTTIEQMVHKFMKEGRTKEINVEHSVDVSGVYVVEIACTDASRGVNGPEGLELKDGSAWCTLKVDNPKVWESVKDKTFEGISLEGLFGMKQEFKKQESLPKNLPSSTIDIILDPEASYKAKYKALVNDIANKK